MGSVKTTKSYWMGVGPEPNAGVLMGEKDTWTETHTGRRLCADRDRDRGRGEVATGQAVPRVAGDTRVRRGQEGASPPASRGSRPGPPELGK